MAEERDLPPGDTRWAKVTSPMEHGALEEVLPVDRHGRQHSSFPVYFLLVNFYYLQYF